MIVSRKLSTADKQEETKPTETPVTARSSTSKSARHCPLSMPLDDFGRSYFPRAQYEEARAQRTFDILDIRYPSDGLDVPGVLIRPKNSGNRKWPMIIYNRGGTGDYGRITNDDHA